MARKPPKPVDDGSALALFHPAVREWFNAVFGEATRPQQLGWPAIARGDNTLILAPTGTGKTLAAFLWCIERLMFESEPPKKQRCRILYISPIKALAVDVERNLQAPLVGIANAAAKLGVKHVTPRVGIRTGDTPPAERARWAREPSDILITTPESLYLLLTSNARENLRSVDTVIVDEIHALVPTKRGVHLALSLERLEQLCGRPVQRIGLSATQRPLDEVSHFLGGVQTPPPERAVPQDITPEQVASEFEATTSQPIFRPVTIVDAGQRKRLDLSIQVPVEDMARIGELDEIPSGSASQAPVRYSIWQAIYPKLLDLVRAHTSTLIFVNNRRTAERLSGALNELAGSTLVRAHHGSVAMAQRKEIEDRLKMGQLQGLVATSSLELGIDMGAIDLVVQVESPPSVASGMQRIGRASHHVGAVSKGTIFPKYRADLVACAAVTRAMYDGLVESTHYPRNTLDVLAQQIVAMVAMDSWNVEDLFATVRRAAPFAALTRPLFEGVLDMLSGRYPSDEFAELRPRLTWDRVTNTLTTRAGARQIAISNGGTIPDRGLYGVFLAGSAKPVRVGELDEEMVFESHNGDTFVLGASTWRVEEITHDRVLVSPAPGEPGKMPFWHGDAAGRPLEFGERIGAMTRELRDLPPPAAVTKLTQDHSLDERAAENLLRYLADQVEATRVVPDDRNIVIERTRDELGDWRICVMTPFGARIHTPWAMAATAKLRHEHGIEAETLWTDDGFVLRLPDTDEAPNTEFVIVDPGELHALLLRQLGNTALFAAKFRENAARALLLPKRRAGARAPLWQQRRRAHDLLGVASRYGSFPMLLETYRECLRDVFDVPALTQTLRRVRAGDIRVTTVDSDRPSPFASALLFSYVANYIYEGDAPLAERRAQALSIDTAQLRELLGDSDLRELLDAAALDEVEAQLQMLDPDYQARHADAIHDMLLRLGDLAPEELARRCASPEVAASFDTLVRSRRVVLVKVDGERRYIAVEDAARYRDALGTPLPPGLPDALLMRSSDPLLEILRRYARTHGPFTTTEVAARFELLPGSVEAVLRRLVAQGRILEGEFRPHGTHREWCDIEVLRLIRRKSLAKLRRQVEPVEQRVYARLVTRWQGLVSPRRGIDALVEAIEVLQGAPLVASELERSILPARVSDYKPEYLDMLLASGELVWRGIERIGERDGRIALYLRESASALTPPPQQTSPQLSERAEIVLEYLRRNGASFFAQVHDATGGGYPGDTVDALWELVWAGLATNDTYHAVRNFTRTRASERQRREHIQPGSPGYAALRSRRLGGLANQGRWSLLPAASADVTQWSAATAQQLLARYGVVAREIAVLEGLYGGYASVYPALKAMEDAGRARRGMFVADMGAAQFAMPPAVDLLRSMRADPERPEVLYLASTDPANPYGATIRWPRDDDSAGSSSFARAAGAGVVFVNGALTAYLRRRNPSIRVFLPEEEPQRGHFARALASKLAELAASWQASRSGLLISEIDGRPAKEHPLAQFLQDAGFASTAMGFQMRRSFHTRVEEPETFDEDDEAVEQA